MLDLTEVKTVPHVPLSHPFVERVIGTVRREFLDRALFWSIADLEAKLIDFQHFYNADRTHSALGGKPPEPPADKPGPPLRLASYRWQKHCRGLYQTRNRSVIYEFDMDTARMAAAVDPSLHHVCVPGPKTEKRRVGGRPGNRGEQEELRPTADGATYISASTSTYPWLVTKLQSSY